MIRSTLIETYGSQTPYVKYVMRKFHNAMVYIQDDEIIGFIVWRVVPKDISKHTMIDRYIHVMAMNTQQDDLNMRSIMIRDIERFSVEKGITSITLEVNTHDEGRFYQYLGFLIVSVFPSIVMRKVLASDPGIIPGFVSL